MKYVPPSEEELARRGMGKKPAPQREEPQGDGRVIAGGAEVSVPTLREGPPKEPVNEE